MGVTRFESQVVASTVGSADIDKLAQSFEKLSGSIDNSGNSANKVAQHPGFEGFAEKLKAGIENPMQGVTSAATAAAEALGPVGVAAGAAAGVFAAGGIAIFEAAKSLGEFGVRVRDVELRTGFSAKQVGEFSFAAQAAGQEVSIFERMMRGLTMAVEDNSTKGQTARGWLTKFGVDMVAVRDGSASTAQVMMQVADGLGQLPTVFERNKAALDLFKKSGIEAIPVLEGLVKNVKIAAEHSLGYSQVEIEKDAEYLVRIKLIERAWDGVLRKLKEIAVEIPVGFAGGIGAAAIERDYDKAHPAIYTEKSLSKEREVREAAAATRAAGDAAVTGWENTHGTSLARAEAALKKLNVPTVGKSSAEEVAAYRAAERKVESIKSQTKATADLETAEKSLEAFEQQMAQKDLGPVAKLYAQADALIAKDKLTGAMAERARSAVRIPAFDALQKEEDEQTKRNEKLSRELTKIAEEHGKEWETVYKDIGTAAQRSVDIWIKTGEQVSQINVQGQIQRAGGASQQRIGFLGMAAAPGQEGLLANAEYVERLALAKQIYDLEKAAADARVLRDKDTQAQRETYARSFAALKDAEYEAEAEHVKKIGELQRRRVDEFRSEMGGVFDALLGGGKGIEQFVINQARTIARAAFSNIMTAEFKTHDPLTRNTVFGGTFLADPTKDVASTKLLGAGDHLHTAAASLQEAARALATSRSGGGGGLVSGAAGGIGIFSGAGGGLFDNMPRTYAPGSSDANSTYNDPLMATAGRGTEEFGVDGSGGSQPPGISSGGWGKGGGWGKALGIGGALVGAGVGIYSGVKEGGARGELTGAGSLAGAAGTIMMLAGMTGPAAPIVAGIGLALGLIPSLMGDPRKQRSDQLAQDASMRAYTMPSGADYSMDASGRYDDYNYQGKGRQITIVNAPNIYAMDSTSFRDFLLANPHALSTGITAAIAGGNGDDIVGTLQARSGQ